MIHLDTHVVVWFYQGNKQKLLPVWPLLENEELAISPMVVLELEFLFEVGKTAEGASAVVAALERGDLNLPPGGLQAARGSNTFRLDEQWGQHKGHGRKQLDEHMQRGACGVLAGIAHGVAHDSRLVSIGTLTA